MYKKEIAVLTEELARVKAARQDLEMELARRELEHAELKKNAVEVEKNANERIKSVRQDLETELAKLRDSLAKRELEQAQLKKDLYEERLLRKQLETVVNELPISILPTDGPGVSPSQPMAIVQKPIVQLEVESPSIPNGIYFIKNRTGNIYWNVQDWEWPRMKSVRFWTTERNILECDVAQVNEHSPIIQVLKG